MPTTCVKYKKQIHLGCNLSFQDHKIQCIRVYVTCNACLKASITSLASCQPYCFCCSSRQIFESNIAHNAEYGRHVGYGLFDALHPSQQCFSHHHIYILWKVKTAISLCVLVSFCMLSISFYFLNYAIISCKLYYDNSF